MNIVVGIFIGLIVLVFLVVVHELGHAIAARRNGVGVEEFGIGFPPRAWARKLKNGVLFTLNWLPIGGFVRLQGEYDSASEPGDYGAATFWQKTKIILAGVLINWVVAAVILSVLAVTGLPKVIPNQFTVPSDTRIVSAPVEVVAVSDGTPAEKIGLKTGDQILEFAGSSLDNSENLAELTAQHKGQTVNVKISSAAGVEDKTVTLRDDSSDGKGYLGASFGQRSFSHSTWSAPIVGVAVTGQMTGATFAGIGSMFGNLAKGLVQKVNFNSEVRDQGSESIKQAGEGVAGPVSIIGVLFPAAEKAGITQLALLTAIISLSLAVVNVLPIPALDGGRWYTMAIFKLLRKKLTKSREEIIQTVGFLVILGLIVLVTVVDIGRLM